MPLPQYVLPKLRNTEERHASVDAHVQVSSHHSTRDTRGTFAWRRRPQELSEAATTGVIAQLPHKDIQHRLRLGTARTVVAGQHHATGFGMRNASSARSDRVTLQQIEAILHENLQTTV